ncbi:MAG: hypothetical protein IPM64_06725 [Phycisphaerales bacterium]|nr:hypothetical protein [Phycisphaerales bacterium]
MKHRYCRASAALIAIATPLSALAIIGPDVTVSTIDNFTKYGTVGGISGFAMTTVSCNIGDRNAIWIDCTNPDDRNCNQHPVIGQNFYKLHVVNGATRFEMIGMAWLKHGFCGADASGPNCAGSQPGFPASCQNDGTCDSLGIGCTDTYGAGLNAAQDDLGPRSEINPWSGYYPYPYVRAWNATGNAIYKRLQIQNADLVANANLNAYPMYFAESQYVVTDEQPNVRHNNVSYRQAQVSGTVSNPGVAFVSGRGTVPRQPALNAWATHDPGVQITTVDLPNDGRLMLGYKVTQLANGRWHYEYALYNMNSHQAVRSFGVPAPDWYVYENQGFKDIPYHSGEVFDGTDWPHTKTQMALTWNTQTNAQNINANALRWGTIYNFRFDSDAPPGPGNVSLQLFQGINQTLPTPTAPNPPAVAPPAAPVLMAAIVPQFKGDMNCDGLLNNLDIDPFVMAITFPNQYQQTFPNCNMMNGDVNNDGAFSNFDIDPFVALLVE